MHRSSCHPYCIRPCAEGADDVGAAGAGCPCQTPRGGSNRRPGGAFATGAPQRGRESNFLDHHARESKNPDQKAADPQRIKDPDGLGEAYLRGLLSGDAL